MCVSEPHFLLFSLSFSASRANSLALTAADLSDRSCLFDLVADAAAAFFVYNEKKKKRKIYARTCKLKLQANAHFKWPRMNQEPVCHLSAFSSARLRVWPSDDWPEAKSNSSVRPAPDKQSVLRHYLCFVPSLKSAELNVFKRDSTRLDSTGH